MNQLKFRKLTGFLKHLTFVAFFLSLLVVSHRAVSSDMMTESAFATTVEGTVKDASGEGLPGVSIIIQGTSQGTTTNLEGKFSLDVPSESSILVFSYVGYASQELVVGTNAVIDVTLAEDSQQLGEVVVVGYGSLNKTELTSSVASLKGVALTNVIASTPVTSLQGRLAGLQVESSGGQPGGPANVFIRGVNSLSNAAPLYVVDGMFVKNLDQVNPKDIVDLSVLKDAAAGAIYGSRAANGVILVTTNHGGFNKPLEVNLDLKYGVESASKKLDFVDGQEYATYLNQVNTNDGGTSPVSWNNVNTDWQEESLTSGAVSDIGLSFSGGSKESSFFGSINKFKQEGILVGSGFERLNMRLNSKHLFKKFTFTQTASFTQGKRQDNNWYGFDGTTAPTVALTNNANAGGFEAASSAAQGPGGVNQYALATLEDNLTTIRNFMVNGKLDYNVTDELTISANMGADLTNTNVYQFTPTYFMSTVDAVRNVNTENDLTDYDQEDISILFEPIINYDKEMGNSKLSAILGYTYFKETQKGLGIYGQGTPSNSVRVAGALPSNDAVNLLGQENTAGLISYFGRLNYNLNDKYMLSATLRRDASSRFATKNQVGYFPSVSAAWNISEEMSRAISAVSFFKIRTSYGELGSYPDVFYPTQAVFISNQSNTSFGGALANGLAQLSIADNDLVWETTKTFDIGFDLGLMEDRLNITADYYSKNIEDVLVAVNVPSTSGVTLPVTRNAGNLINNGLELAANYDKNEGTFKYTLGGNISFNLKSEAGDIPAPILGPGIDEDLRVVNRTISNQPIGAYYGYVVEDKVDPATGNFVRVDTDGDGDVDGDDQTVIGDPTPDFTYGINLAGQYKNFDFALDFVGVKGNEIYNLSRYY